MRNEQISYNTFAEASKTDTILYWLVTIPFLIWMTASAFGFLTPVQDIVDSISGESYQTYVLQILGVLKILGVIAILQTKNDTIKEIAYGGFMINLVGASGSLLFSGDSIIHVVIPLFVLSLVITSYRYWKKIPQ